MRDRAASVLRACSGSPLVRNLLAITAMLVLWKLYSSGLQDAILWCLFLYGLRHWRRALAVWSRPPGALFLAVAVHTLLLAAWSTDPKLSFRELTKLLDVVAVAAVMPGLLRTREQVGRLALYTGIALTLILGVDLVRLCWVLKADVLAAAHEYEPFALGHSPNIAAASAACGVLMMLACAWGVGRSSNRRAGSVLCGAAAVINLAYLVVIASRGAQVALAATAVLAACLAPRRHTVRLVMAGVLLIAIAVLALHPEWVNPRFKDPVSMKGLADRDKVWQHTWELCRDRPFTGYGYGHKVFKQVYHSASPPQARFHFNHPHQYWLNALFSGGWPAVVLQLLAWSWLGMGLLRQTLIPADPRTQRRLPLLLLLLVAFIHVFGLGDYPGSMLRMLLIWLVPCALVCVAPVSENPA